MGLHDYIKNQKGLTSSLIYSVSTTFVGLINNLLFVLILIPGDFSSWNAISSFINLIAYLELGNFIAFRGLVESPEFNFQVSKSLMSDSIKKIFLGSLLLFILALIMYDYNPFLILVLIIIKSLQTLVDFGLIAKKKDGKLSLFYLANLYPAMIMFFICVCVYFSGKTIHFTPLIVTFYFCQLFFRILMGGWNYKLFKNVQILNFKLQPTSLMKILPRIFVPVIFSIIFSLIPILYENTVSDKISLLVKIYFIYIGLVNLVLFYIMEQLHHFGSSKQFLSTLTFFTLVFFTGITLNYIYFKIFDYRFLFILSLSITAVYYLNLVLWILSNKIVFSTKKFNEL